MTHAEFKKLHGEDAWSRLVEPRTRAPFPNKIWGMANDIVHQDIIMPVLHLLGFKHADGLLEVQQHIEEVMKALDAAPDPDQHKHRGGDADEGAYRVYTDPIAPQHLPVTRMPQVQREYNVEMSYPQGTERLTTVLRLSALDAADAATIARYRTATKLTLPVSTVQVMDVSPVQAG